MLGKLEIIFLMLYIPTIISIIEVLIVTVPVLLTVAFVTIAERKTMASMQRRLGPNIVGYYGLLQAFADALKLLLKEYVSPTQANLILFFLGPIITLIFSLLGYAVIPYGPGLTISDFNLGILYMLAVSSLSTYGILLAGWSANSKYAFLGLKGPNLDVNLYLKQTICEKIIKRTLLSLLDTLFVTPYFFLYTLYRIFNKEINVRKEWMGRKVKILLKMINPQVTKAFNSWLGTSEAIRLLSINFYRENFVKQYIKGYTSYIKVNHPFLKGEKSLKSKSWKQWLAGLIDGNGSFHLTKKGYSSLEITMGLRDEHALQRIKNIYGGSIKTVLGKNALRYCVRHKQGILALVKDVNGEIRNSYRLLQLNKICLKYGITIIYPEKTNYDNGWLSGFFDSQGYVTFNSSSGQLAIFFTQKTSEILKPLIFLYGGSVYIDRTSKKFKWYISNRNDIFRLLDYFKKYPSRSLKKNRLHLIPMLYELKERGADKASLENRPLLSKSWKLLKDKWDKYEM